MPPEPVIAPTPDPIVVQPPVQSKPAPILAKGFDDPAFLEAAQKAFDERDIAARNKPEPKEDVEEPSGLLAPGVKSPEEPKVDRPPVPRKASEWAAFHDAKSKVEKELSEARAKLESFNGFDPKEYENTKTANKSLSEKLEAIALERSDKFQKYFNDSADSIRALVKSAVGDKADKVIKLLDLPDSDWRTEQLEAITEELTPLRRAKMERAFADMDKLAIERNKVIENSAENWKKLQQAEQMERDHQSEQFMRTFESEIKSMSDPEKGIAPFQTKDGDSTWNKSVKDRIEKARAIYAGNISPEEKARYAAFSSAIPEFEKTFTDTLKENAALKEEMAKLRSAEPGLEQGGEQKRDTDKDLEGLNYGEAVARMIQKAGGFPNR